MLSKFKTIKIIPGIFIVLFLLLIGHCILSECDQFGDKIKVFIYVLLIGSMALSALFIDKAHWHIVFVGACLFILSDSINAIDNFGGSKSFIKYSEDELVLRRDKSNNSNTTISNTLEYVNHQPSIIDIADIFAGQIKISESEKSLTGEDNPKIFTDSILKFRTGSLFFPKGDSLLKVCSLFVKSDSVKFKVNFTTYIAGSIDNKKTGLLLIFLTLYYTAMFFIVFGMVFILIKDGQCEKKAANTFTSSKQDSLAGVA
jgi:hypothetical protein